MTNGVVNLWVSSSLPLSQALPQPPLSPPPPALPFLLWLASLFISWAPLFLPIIQHILQISFPGLNHICSRAEFRQPEGLHITPERGWLKKGVSQTQPPGTHMPGPPSSPPLLQEHPLPRPHTTLPKLYNSHSSTAEPLRQQHNTTPPTVFLLKTATTR